MIRFKTHEKLYVFGVLAPLLIFTILALFAPSQDSENFLILIGASSIAIISAGMFASKNKFVARSYVLTFIFWVVIPGTFIFSIMRGYMVAFSSSSFQAETFIIYGCAVTVLGLIITYFIFIFLKFRSKG